MTYKEPMLFVVKQQKLTRNVVTCYEAGDFGFHLHRRFEELGIKNYVERPQDWDERGKGVKNDRLDAEALCQRLDRYERGNKKAFSTVLIPTVDEERERAMSRQRQQLMRERQRAAALEAAPYERTCARKGYVNGFKPKTIHTPLGSICVNLQQVRGDIDFYTSALEKLPDWRPSSCPSRCLVRKGPHRR
jgi:hypothetical protein